MDDELRPMQRLLLELFGDMAYPTDGGVVVEKGCPWCRSLSCMGTCRD